MHLVVAVHCIQFQERIFFKSSFSEWSILIDEIRPQCVVRKDFQKFLQLVSHVVLIININLKSLGFTIFARKQLLSFSVPFYHFFFSISKSFFAGFFFPRRLSPKAEENSQICRRSRLSHSNSIWDDRRDTSDVTTSS